ncbi:MAG: hypothetical protein WBW99_17060 [Pseudolabrys sp.]
MLLFDGHPEDVRGTLQKCDVIFAELAFGSTVDFEHAEGRAITLQNHIHRTPNSVFYEQLGGPKSLLVFEMIGNYGLARAQGIAGRRGQIDPDGCIPDHSLAPPYASANQKPVLGRNVLHHFAVFRSQTFRRRPGGVVEHFKEARALQGDDTEFGEQLLLANTQTKRATGQVVCLTIAGLLNDRLFRFIWRAHS